MPEGMPLYESHLRHGLLGLGRDWLASHFGISQGSGNYPIAWISRLSKIWIILKIMYPVVGYPVVGHAVKDKAVRN